MTRTHGKVSDALASKAHAYTRETATEGIEKALRLLEGRWKLMILFQLFGGHVLRFSDLERAIAGVSQKMLIQQLGRWKATDWCAASFTFRCRRRSSIV
ncbi:MAG: helix-turn-helix domain-containing protein [Rhizomicrobium sp.]